MRKLDNNLIAWYPFDDNNNPGKDISGKENNAIACGNRKPFIKKEDEIFGAVFSGGEGGDSSYFELPQSVLEYADDMTGLSISAWIRPGGKALGWERIFDFGHDQNGPYLFLTRSLRGICYADSDLPADAGMAAPLGKWTHVVLAIAPSMKGTASSAGPKLYVNGDLAADGIISQTSSGNYKKFRSFMDMLSEGKLDHNYIGKSMFDVDPYYEGMITDFRIYNKTLSLEEVTDIFCEKMTDEQILDIARDKFLQKPQDIITDHVNLASSLMKGRVTVSWDIKPAGIIDSKGFLCNIQKPVSLIFTATLKKGNKSVLKSFKSEAVPGNTIPYEFVLHKDEKVLDISKTLFGLFFEDINHSADGGIYAEMVQNRSFENFTFSNYNTQSTENGLPGERKYKPLEYWYGDTDKVEVLSENGVSSYLGYEEERNPHYLKALENITIVNHGFCGEKGECAMAFYCGALYDFSIYAKSKIDAKLVVVAQNSEGIAISEPVTIIIPAESNWSKYTNTIQIQNIDKPVTMGQLSIEISKGCCIDMVSLMPRDVWGAKEEKGSKSANRNFNANPNYRMRRDIMKCLVDMHPSFIRFPGGCISEGSYTWENVYDWKDSVLDVALRKENVNVWGYNMTLGLGYMEYFQMAEDLGAEPLPVMACGVLCQARSDYANPAGGYLREKYISNFIDLIDFAISTDFDNNKWAAIRKDMGHENPFGLHYLGVGNENWGDEFFANFEIFYHRIKEHLDKFYPEYPLTIVSTAGAQADDDAYKIGWQFLCGKHKGVSSYRFTNGKESFEEEINWYKYKEDYLDTIVDEHYYRSNDYLLENVDRYNYYQRAYRNDIEKGIVLDEDKSPKVFVGEYASTDKNTLKGAIAEAATMIGYERNSDVVRMASTAPLFNQISTDGTYRWTPDCIWFDKTNVYRTPSYFVQQLFMTNLGKELIRLDEKKIEDGEMTLLKPHGGFCLSASNGRVKFLNIKVTSNIDGTEIFYKNFEEGIIIDASKATGYLFFDDDFDEFNKNKADVNEFNKNKADVFEFDKNKADVNEFGKAADPIKACIATRNPAFKKLSDYTVTVKAIKLDEDAVIEVGCGLVTQPGGFDESRMNLFKYCIGDSINGTGLKVYKNGVQGYTMGDYSSSVYAGNLRACHMEKVSKDVEVTTSINFGGSGAGTISASYVTGKRELGKLTYKLESYNADIFASATKDDEYIYLKFVNAFDTAKDVRVVTGDSISGFARVIVLRSPSSLWDVTNVNVPEKVKPDTYNIALLDGSFCIKLAPWSLNIVKIQR